MQKYKIPKQVLILSFISLFTDIASEMLYPITPIFLTSVLGAKMSVVGIIEGFSEVTSGLLKGYFGRLSDKIKRRSVFVSTGYSLSSAVKSLPGFFPFVSTVLFSRVTDRIGKGIRTAPRDALLASYVNGNSGAIFGFHRGMDTLGATIGPAIALTLLFFYPNNFILIYILALIPSTFAFVFTFFIKDNFISSEKNISLSYFEFLKSSPAKYKMLLLLFTLFSFANSSDVFLILKAKEISNSETIAIAGYIFYNLIYALTSYPIGKLSDKSDKKKILLFGLGVYSLTYFGFAFANRTELIFVFFIFYGIYASSTEGISKAIVSDIIPNEQRASAIGLLTMLSSFAIMFGSFLAGILWDSFGSSIPFVFSGSLVLILIILFVSFSFKEMNFDF